MSNTVENIQASYVASGSDTDFSFSFKVFDSSDVQVFTYNETSEVLTHVNPVDYTVNLNPEGNGGEVVFNSAPTNGLKVIIRRKSDFVQESEYDNSNNGITMEGLEAKLDDITSFTQELKDEVSRSLKLPFWLGSPPLIEPLTEEPEDGEFLMWQGGKLINQSSTVDLTDYYTKSEIDAQQAQQQIDWEAYSDQSELDAIAAANAYTDAEVANKVDTVDGVVGSASVSVTGSGTSADPFVISNLTAGEANTASNLGSGEGVFAQKNMVDLEFKSLATRAEDKVSKIESTSTEVELGLKHSNNNGDLIGTQVSIGSFGSVSDDNGMLVTLQKLASNGEVIIGMPVGGTQIYRSTNAGIFFTQVNVGAIGYTEIAMNGDNVVIAGDGLTPRYSNDAGITWSDSSAGSDDLAHGIFATENGFVGVGEVSDTLLYSQDGSNFTAIPGVINSVLPSGTANYIADTGNGRTVLLENEGNRAFVIRDNAVITQLDATQMSDNPAVQSMTTNLVDLVFGNGFFLLSNDIGAVHKTVDGVEYSGEVQGYITGAQFGPMFFAKGHHYLVQGSLGRVRRYNEPNGFGLSTGGFNLNQSDETWVSGVEARAFDGASYINNIVISGSNSGSPSSQITTVPYTLSSEVKWHQSAYTKSIFFVQITHDGSTDMSSGDAVVSNTYVKRSFNTGVSPGGHFRLEGNNFYCLKSGFYKFKMRAQVFKQSRLSAGDSSIALFEVDTPSDNQLYVSPRFYASPENNDSATITSSELRLTGFHYFEQGKEYYMAQIIGSDNNKFEVPVTSDEADAGSKINFCEAEFDYVGG